jgi:HNH endonuclease
MGWSTARYTDDEVRAAVASSRSISEALRKLGLRAAGHNYRTLRRLIERHGIATDHMDPNWVLRGSRRPTKIPLDEILVAGSHYNRQHLKNRLYEAGLKQRRCELCGQQETWHGRPMSLILDHVNGIATDNRLENLRIVCPNCNATLDTHCGRQNRLDIRPRKCLHCAREFMPKYATHRYCSHACGTHSKGSHDPKPDTRKVARPPYEQLMADLAATNFCAVGRKYGVSDNAVRKWVRWYEAERERAARPGPPDPRVGEAGGEAGGVLARGGLGDRPNSGEWSRASLPQSRNRGLRSLRIRP